MLGYCAFGRGQPKRADQVDLARATIECPGDDDQWPGWVSGRRRLNSGPVPVPAWP